MKTLHLISTVVIVSLFMTSYGRSDDSDLQISILNIISPTCNGANNGAVSIEATGGEAPYTYNWNTFPTQYTTEATNLNSGIYFIQVTDASGEVIFKSINVEDPNISSLSTVRDQASDMNITASVSGQNGPYSYELNGDNILGTQNYDLNLLPVGIHQLVITDGNNCQMMQYIQVYELEESEELDNTTSQEKIISKDEHAVRASRLIPTQIDAEENISNPNILLSPIR